MWFVKAKRAQTNEDDETWIEGGTVPTLNAFDNGDTRATVLIFEATRVEDVRIYESYSPTVATYWGTGGARVPYVYSIREDAKADNFSANEINVTNALQAHQPSPQSHHSQTFIIENYTVRRLTPIECERLQGFPDNWTDGQADSSRYKQMGNAVAVPVVNWIIERMIK